MLISRDHLSLNLLEDGTPLEVILKNSSRSYFRELKKHHLVTTRNKKVYLTPRGKVASKMGLKRYLAAEEFEREISTFGSEENQKHQRLFIISFSLSLLALFLLLFYIISLI